MLFCTIMRQKRSCDWRYFFCLFTAFTNWLAAVRIFTKDLEQFCCQNSSLVWLEKYLSSPLTRMFPLKQTNKHWLYHDHSSEAKPNIRAGFKDWRNSRRASVGTYASFAYANLTETFQGWSHIKVCEFLALAISALRITKVPKAKLFWNLFLMWRKKTRALIMVSKEIHYTLSFSYVNKYVVRQSYLPWYIKSCNL